MTVFEAASEILKGYTNTQLILISYQATNVHFGVECDTHLLTGYFDAIAKMLNKDMDYEINHSVNEATLALSQAIGFRLGEYESWKILQKRRFKN